MTDEDYRDAHIQADCFLDDYAPECRTAADMAQAFNDEVVVYLPCLDMEEYSEEEVQDYAEEAERAAVDYLKQCGERKLAENLSHYGAAPSRARRVMGAFRAFLKERVRLLWGGEFEYECWRDELVWC